MPQESHGLKHACTHLLVSSLSSGKIHLAVANLIEKVLVNIIVV